MSAPATQPATTSATPWTLVRLRWALTNAALKTSPWQIVAYVLAYLLAAGTVVGTGVLAFAVGHGMAHDVWPYLPVIMPLAGTAGILFVALLQAMFIGENSTMSMDKFAPYGIPDRTLQLGLLLAGLTGIPAITALVSFMLWAMAYRGFGAAAVASQLVAAPLIVLTAMCVSKALLAVADIITDSQAGKNIFYVVVIMLFVALAQMPNILMINEASVEAASLIPVARVFGWLPLGAPFMLPFDAANGQWLFWVLHVLCALALCAVCFLVSQWCLHWQRTHSSDAVRAKAARGLGLFSRMPDSPSGAISARLGSLLRRDARQSMMYIMPLFFVVIFALENKDIGSWFVWMGVLLGGMFMSLTESNGLAYDGQGFVMEVIAGTRAIDDRTGRVRIYLIIDTVYIALLSVITFIITGDWSSPSGLAGAFTFIAASWGWAVASLGVAEMFNCSVLYPVPSMAKPFTNPQGRGAAQAFLPFLYMLASLASILPTAIVAIVIFATGNGAAYPWIIPVALANGVVFLCLGTWLGAKLLRTRMLKVVQTLDSFAALQQ
ncbi:ABC transporter permease [Bifidobacterium pseudolongum]|uniref:Transporter n=1 Tax=Bifidobacterium pseudolongum subsp. globosum TaxID=1690 RepID=A0AB37X3D1_9BIFI|nr:ABC transporter permease [Bifidobacterium pseudolongum]MBS6344825.1 ABC transporter permease [Bifidobacterium pseudolongum]RYQ38598.1 transporter [Bifidobacterium pseudolongum subsp. globosum]